MGPTYKRGFPGGLPVQKEWEGPGCKTTPQPRRTPRVITRNFGTKKLARFARYFEKGFGKEKERVKGEPIR